MRPESAVLGDGGVLVTGIYEVTTCHRPRRPTGRRGFFFASFRSYTPRTARLASENSIDSIDIEGGGRAVVFIHSPEKHPQSKPHEFFWPCR